MSAQDEVSVAEEDFSNAKPEGEEEEKLDERVKMVLLGRLENLPSLANRIVRIFTSSTFTGILILSGVLIIYLDNS